ncbi:hypothetical protein D3C81_1203470 [compost metagenome]
MICIIVSSDFEGNGNLTIDHVLIGILQRIGEAHPVIRIPLAQFVRRHKQHPNDAGSRRRPLAEHFIRLSSARDFKRLCVRRQLSSIDLDQGLLPRAD